MTKRLAALSLAVLTAAIGGFVVRQSLTQPELTWDPAAYGFRFLADLNKDYTFTKGVIYNRTDRPIEIRDVRVGYLPEGVTLLGVAVADSEKFQDSPLVFGPQFPPPEVAASDVHPPAGFILLPSGGIRVLIGLRVTDAGVHNLGTVIVDYGPQWLGRTATLLYTIRVCAPAADFWGPGETMVGCDAPDPQPLQVVASSSPTRGTPTP